jgi:hypothetical protein
MSIIEIDVTKEEKQITLLYIVGKTRVSYESENWGGEKSDQLLSPWLQLATLEWVFSDLGRVEMLK